MFRRFSFWRFLATLLLIAVLVGGGVALYQAGFGQGYQAGLLALAHNDGTTPVPAPGYYWPAYFGFGFPFFNPFGILLGIGFFLFVFFVIGGLFRFAFGRRWDGQGGPHGYGWRRGWGPNWDRPPEGERNKNDQTL